MSELKETLIKLAGEEGLEVCDVGQGRGGECQFLSVLFTVDPTSYALQGGKVVWDYRVVGSFRAAVAEWMRRHEDKWVGGETFRTLALVD